MVHATATRRTGGWMRTADLGALAKTALLPGILALGLGLRLAAAGGSLGLDEAWSLRLAGTLPHVGDAFWGLAHDNNHPLNTATLALLGPGRPAWVYRLPGVLLGGLTVAAVAAVLRRRGPAAAGIGALLAAVCTPLVDFGSEARGYAGLSLATVLAIGFWERAVTAAPGDPPRRGAPARWGLAGAAAFGTLCHPGMGLTLAVLGVATPLCLWTRARRLGPAMAGTLRLFGPTVGALLPVLAAFAVAVHGHGGLRIGDVDPFAPGKLVRGMGDTVALMAGLPAAPAAPLAAAAVLLGLVWAWRRGLLGLPAAALSVAAFPVLFAALWVGHVPNTGYPRYFAVCAVVLLLAVAEAGGGLWRKGGRARAWAVAVLGGVVAGNLAADAAIVVTGRSGAGETLAIMRAEGGATYRADRPLMAALLLDAARGEGPVPAATEPSCAAPPDWFIAVGLFDSRPDGTATVGDPACPLAYRVRATFGSNPLSGTQWTLYRRPS